MYLDDTVRLLADAQREMVEAVRELATATKLLNEEFWKVKSELDELRGVVYMNDGNLHTRGTDDE